MWFSVLAVVLVAVLALVLILALAVVLVLGLVIVLLVVLAKRVSAVTSMALGSSGCGPS